MTFEIIPAIDLSEGSVVQLRQGLMEQKTVFGDDPASAARRWEQLGAARLHVIDLDATVRGAPPARQAVTTILDSVSIPVQLGGGIRDLDTARGWVEAGIDRVILGTAAVTDPAFLRAALDAFAGRVVVALDFRDREVKVSGWQEGSGAELIATVCRLAAEGVCRLLCTDIARDGMLRGPNVEVLAEVAEAAQIPVIASGGVTTVDDLRTLSRIPGVEAAIIGTALYTGDIQLDEALTAVGAS